MKNRNLESLNVGDKVTRVKSGWYFSEVEVRTVARILKNSIVDSKGDRWTLRGDAWGSANSYYSGRPSLWVWTPEDDERIVKLAEEKKIREKKTFIMNYNWSKASPEILDGVHALISQTARYENKA